MTNAPGLVWLSGREGPWRTTMLLDTNAGVVRMALRDRGVRGGTSLYCLAGAASHGTEVGVYAQLLEFNSSGSTILRSWTQFLRGSLDEPGALTTVGRRDGLSAALQTFRVTGTSMAAEAEGTAAWRIQDDGVVELISAPLEPDLVQELHLIGDDVFWTDWGDRVSMARATPSEAARVFHSVPGGDVRSFTTDGATLAWLAATEQDLDTGRYGHLELWAATYDGDALEARRVRDIELLQNGIVGGGYFVRVDRDPSDGAQVYAVYRLTDGAVAYVRTPTGEPAQQVVQVSDEMLIFQVFDTVFRIDPATLTFG